MPGIAIPSGSLVGPTAIVDENEFDIRELAEQHPEDTDTVANTLSKLSGLTLPDSVGRVLRASLPVGRLATAEGTATGVLITPSILLTNNHAFAGSENAREAEPKDAEAEVTFGYYQTLDGQQFEGTTYSTLPNVHFAANRTLDFAVVAVADRPGDTWGVVTIPDPEPELKLGRDVYIVQHPDGEPQFVTMAENEIAYFNGTVVQYTADTLEGSSGAPVYDWAWRLIALHRRGGDIEEPDSGGLVFRRNEGVRIPVIVRELSERGTLQFD